MCQALASGYRRVYCTAEVEEARALRDALGDGILGGERQAVRIPGFDLGNSPREYLEAAGETLILSTTNGTRAVVSAATRCERVLIASLLNLSAVVDATREAGEDVVVVCAGVQGRSRSTTRTSPAASSSCSSGSAPTQPLPPRAWQRHGAVRRTPSARRRAAATSWRTPRSSRPTFPSARERASSTWCRGSSHCAKTPPKSPSEEIRGITRLVESSRAGAGLHSTR